MRTLNTKKCFPLRTGFVPFAFLYLAFLLSQLSICFADVALKDGDIVFQTSLSSQTRPIQLATHSPYSHVGVVLFKKDKAMVFEAGPRVQYTPFDVWVKRGEGNHFVVKRLKREEPFTPAEIEKLRNVANTFEGRRYDRKFEWSDDKMYCSELVWKIYQQAIAVELIAPKKFRDYDLSSPIVQADMKKRYGDKVPLDEEIVSPGALFDSPLLEQIEKE